MQQPASGMSQPSVSTMQLLTSSISPRSSMASVASRSRLGVEPSICPALAELMPMLDDIADELRPIHALGELGFDVVALAGFHAPQVRIDRRVDPRADQISLFDQLG